MTDIKLILNIQLFAEGDGEGGNEMQNAERKTQSVDETQSAERKAQSEMNEEVDSDGLNDGAGDNEKKEAVVEETEEGTDEEIKEGFIREREARLRNRISGWLKESGEIKELYPDFDLRNELRSSRLFAQLILAGAPVKASYEIVHKDEIISGAMAYTADKVRQQVVKNIEAKGRRPLENGISSESAVMTAIDVNALTAKDIHRILKQVENGASIKF
ncbi:MAG: hypothetical protein IJN94_00635 [Clostridia bacterium]|nr:hypothetical protein [Clostridia bacterium]